MKAGLKFFGANDTVTGSLTQLSINNSKVLVDCGQFQGPKEVRARNRRPFPFKISEIDGVFITHAHLDHIGRLPLLCKEGYEGPIYVSQGTYELGRIILLDSAHLEQEFAAYANETGYSNHKPALPLFTTEDAEKAISQFKIVSRNQWHSFNEHLSFKLLRAGHIIGSSILQFQLHNGQKKKIVSFSGDLGRPFSLTLKPAEEIPSSDILVLESTYGGRLHPKKDPLEGLAEEINRIVERQGVLVVPAFAVGRSQDIIFAIKTLEQQKKIPCLPVYLDSPMANSATEIFLRNHEDQKALSAFNETDSFFPKKFEVSTTADESMLACMRDGPLIVISASGMLSGGRILHHLKARLPKPENTVLFTGFQAEGSKGRFLQERNEDQKIRIHHKEVDIEARVTTLDAFSAHADYEEILEYLSKVASPNMKIIVNHGSHESQKILAEKIREKFGFHVECSADCESIDL